MKKPATGSVPNPNPNASPNADRRADPALQGEGHDTAARRYDAGVMNLLDAGKVDAAAPAASKAAPTTAAQAREMAAAEKAGQAPAKTLAPCSTVDSAAYFLAPRQLRWS